MTDIAHKCSKCGSLLDEGAKFCEECGASVDGGPTPPVLATEPAADANPLDDITNTQRMSKIYMKGAEVDRASLRPALTRALTN